MDNRSEEFDRLLRERYPELPVDAVSRACQFYERVLAENELQNLTRLTAPVDFIEGHVADTVELHKSGLLDEPTIDLGSGVGVPGLLFFALFGGNWVLAESEKRKAEFLRSVVQGMGLSKISVEAVRAETYLTNHRAGSVVARAVGSVEKIYGWLRGCSTWNNLVLLKGPKWTEEWDEFSRGRYRKELFIEKQYSYRVREDHGMRHILKLARKNVPRGT